MACQQQAHQQHSTLLEAESLKQPLLEAKQLKQPQNAEFDREANQSFTTGNGNSEQKGLNAKGPLHPKGSGYGDNHNRDNNHNRGLPFGTDDLARDTVPLSGQDFQPEGSERKNRRSVVTEKSNQKTEKLLSSLYLIALCSVGFTSNVLVSLVAPILPNKFMELDIPVVWVGLVFSMYPIAILLFSPLMKMLSEKFGRCSVLSFGLLLQGVAGIIFGYSIFLEKFDVTPDTILAIMLTMRTIQVCFKF